MFILFVSTDSFMLSTRVERFSERNSRVNSSVIQSPHQLVLLDWLLVPASGVFVDLAGLRAKHWVCLQLPFQIQLDAVDSNLINESTPRWHYC